MRKLEEKEKESIREMLGAMHVDTNDKFIAIETVKFSDNSRHMLVKESDGSFEDAAEGLWRMECGCIESSMRNGTTCSVIDEAVYFISGDAAFESIYIHGGFHGVFDKGHVKFMDVMWYELKDDIKDALDGKPFNNDNGWTMKEAVDEMVALWETGDCDTMPWDIVDDWVFIDEELHDVLASPKFGEAKVKQEPKQELSPLMKQYYDLKAKHPEDLLLFRTGDFYETYGDDAQKAAEVLGITVTRSSKSKEQSGRQMRMAGFPYHALDAYLPKLIRVGIRVAICDQIEQPQTKKLVKRGVSELVK